MESQLPEVKIYNQSQLPEVKIYYRKSTSGSQNILLEVNF